MKVPYWIIPAVFPLVLLWAWSIKLSLAFRGRYLEAWEQDLARTVGVKQPEKIKIALVEELPFPGFPGLRRLARHYGMDGTKAVGLTLGHGVFVRHGFYTIKVASHEFRHVHQYETAGSMARLLLRYLGEVLTYGYREAPLERDTRDHEVSGVRKGGSQGRSSSYELASSQE